MNLTTLSLGSNPALLPERLKTVMDVNPQPFSGNIQPDEAYGMCCRAFIIFHLRTLTILDNKIVERTERQEADSWFGEAEASRINRQLEEKEAEVAQLTDAISQLTTQSLDQATTTKLLAREKEEQNRRLAEMQKELAAKDELLQAKTRELLRACLKHSEIEQELAFYRIDSKLAGLGRPPDPGEIPIGSEEDVGNIEESPYLGKCRYIRMATSPIHSNQRKGLRGSLAHGPSPDHEEGFSEQGGRPSEFDPRRAHSMELSRPCVRPTTLDLRPFHHSSYAETDEGASSLEFLQTRSEAIPLRNGKLSRRQVLAMTYASLPSPPKCPITLPYYGQSPDIHDISELEDTDSGGGGIRFNDDRANSTEPSRSQTHSQASGCHANGQEPGTRALDSGIETTNATVHTSGSFGNGDQEQIFEPADPSLEDVQLDSFNSLQVALRRGVTLLLLLLLLQVMQTWPHFHPFRSGSDSAACLQSPEDISRPPSEAVESSMSELTHDSASATEADDSEACGELKFRRSSPSKRRGSCQTPDSGRKKRFQHRAAVSVEASASATERTDSCASARGQPSSWHNKESGEVAR
ncbi:unnamed protein product [Schistocephalus solidus]|uniref:Liprin-beta-1 n=1 Tax=Schistocephalus solidus TaxID=70667 RepID=A0A183SEH2_SCHSO|nr:unnamed protein product [Schistocephalus solidus]